MPLASVNAGAAVRATPSVGVTLLSVTVPTGGALTDALGVSIVVSANCSFSTFHTVSMPSSPAWLSTVTLPLELRVMT